MAARARTTKPAPRTPAQAAPKPIEPTRPTAKAKSAEPSRTSPPKAKGAEPPRTPARAKSAEPPRTSPPKAKSAEPTRPTAKVTFPKKAQPPTDAEFGARLPAAVGKRFEALRGLLKKHDAVEDFYYYGPRTGWAYRYQRGTQSLCSIVILQGRLVGIVALDAAAQARIDWDALTDVTRRARKVAHGTPALLWLDIPLDGSGATDFKSLLRAKLAA